MIDAIIAAPGIAFTAILQACQSITGNWWLALFLFTLATKIVLMPLSIWVQKNYIVMLKLMPDINHIKAQHFGDKETIGEKQNALYHQKHYHPLLSMIPLIVQIIILLCLVNAVYTIAASGQEGTEILGLIPVQSGGAALIVPVLAGLSAYILGLSQNHINPLQREQTRKEQLFVNGLSVALAIVLGLFVACGLGFYWICSNLLSIAVQALANIIIDPKKQVDYEALAKSRKELDKLENIEEEGKDNKKARRKLVAREKNDYRRFMYVQGKHIVFYSEGGGFYKYFKGAIEWLLEHSNITIHYVTNDPNDQVFDLAKKSARIQPYYIGKKRAISFMMKLDADVVVSTLVDLDNYYIKRSYVRHDAFYVFMPHHMTSMHLVVPKESFDHYDALLCAGSHQVREVQQEEKLYNLPKKELVECGYDLLDSDILDLQQKSTSPTFNNGEHPTTDSANSKDLAANNSSRPSVLIAPSWQDDNILDTCIDELLEELLGHECNIIVRPHPEYVKRYKSRWDAICVRQKQAHKESFTKGELIFEEDFSSNETVFNADLLITDWSSIFCEYSFSTLRPCIFIDTPMKVRNPDWEELKMPPVDLSWRKELGVSFEPSALKGLGSTAQKMINEASSWEQKISDVREKSIFNLGHSKEIAGKYLLDKVLEIQNKKDAQEDAKSKGTQKNKGTQNSKETQNPKAKVAQSAGRGAQNEK